MRHTDQNVIHDKCRLRSDSPRLHATQKLGFQIYLGWLWFQLEYHVQRKRQIFQLKKKGEKKKDGYDRNDTSGPKDPSARHETL